MKTITLDPALAVARVEAAETPEAVETILQNARRLVSAAALPAVESVAARRIAILGGASFEDPLAREFWMALIAYERLRGVAERRRFRASRTRQMVQRHGAQEALRRLVNGSETDGFRFLRDAGLIDLAAESIVLRHAADFDDATRAVAESRLAGG